MLLIEDLAQIVGKLIALAVVATLRAALSIVLACIDLGDALSESVSCRVRMLHLHDFSLRMTGACRLIRSDMLAFRCGSLDIVDLSVQKLALRTGVLVLQESRLALVLPQTGSH